MNKTLKQTLKAHNKRVSYNKGHTPTKVFIGGMVIGVIAWELGDLIATLIINLIK